jgi:hypothetical protein
MAHKEKPENRWLLREQFNREPARSLPSDSPKCVEPARGARLQRRERMRHLLGQSEVRRNGAPQF